MIVFRENFTASMDDPVAQRWNSSSIDFADIKMDRNLALLLTSLISAILWIVYITYYNSRVLGYILTRLINKFYFQDDNFKIGEWPFYILFHVHDQTIFGYWVSNLDFFYIAWCQIQNILFWSLVHHNINSLHCL